MPRTRAGAEAARAYSSVQVTQWADRGATGSQREPLEGMWADRGATGSQYEPLEGM